MRPILVIEDSHDDYEIISRVFTKLGVTQPIYRLVVGSDAMDYLNRRMGHQKHADEPLPGLILLDLRLPAADGRDLLLEIKRDPHFREIPVVVMSTSTSPRDISACYAAGANSYIVKAVDIEKYSKALTVMIDYWTNYVEIPV
jgi:CheY-like chemotaxis protein